MTRKYTKKDEDRFVEELIDVDWSYLLELGNASSKVEHLHSVINGLMDKFFPLKEYSIRSTDHPWITDHYRKEVRKRRLEWRRNGRSEKYHRLKKENDVEFKELKLNFYEKECQKLTIPGAVPFSALKHINTPNRPKPWNVLDLFPGMDIRAAAEFMADFFNEISGEFKNLEPSDLPKSYDRVVYEITPERVIERVGKIKKPKSMVPGDIPPRLVSRVMNSLAVPIADIFNATVTTDWPRLWRREYQTIIPKKNSPSYLNDCRNLSCTNFFLVRFWKALYWTVYRQRYLYLTNSLEV